MNKLIKDVWNYDLHAEFYRYRPNYTPRAIEAMLALAFAGGGEIHS